MKDKGISSYLEPLWAVVRNLTLVMILYGLTRFVFWRVNRDFFPDIDTARFLSLEVPGMLFDLWSTLYLSLPYIVLSLLPLTQRSNRAYALVSKILFIVPNFLGQAANLADCLYFPYTTRRTTFTFLKEFEGEGNLGSIVFDELAVNWYILPIGLLILAALIFLYRPIRGRAEKKLTYYLIHSLILLASIYPLIGGMRGGFGVAVRPIAMSNANKYVESPIESAVVLNSPFSFLRTMGVSVFEDPEYFDESTQEPYLEAFNAVRQPTSYRESFTPKNVVVIILEGFGASHSTRITGLQGNAFEGTMPFLDSLAEHSLTFRYSFANGRKSIDALPSVVSGIPSFIEPFFITPFAMNTITSIAGCLKEKGYSSAFYHGAIAGSLGFEAYTHVTGYDGQYSRDTFNDDSAFDGTWAIWDEEFLQYFCSEMGNLKEPFTTAVFTASSHHPYNIPARYETVFPPTSNPMDRCVAYSDMALRKFFESASKQDWYENTLFVLSADHTSLNEIPEYNTDCGLYQIPIVFYTPSGELQGLREGIAQQADILPTVMSYLGYEKPVISFGCDLLTTPDEETFAIDYVNGVYQFYKGDRCLHLNGDQPVGLYAFKTDRFKEHDLSDDEPDVVRAMEIQTKSIVQQYISRMLDNRLVISDEDIR